MVHQLALCSNGSRLASASDNGIIRLWKFNERDILELVRSFEDTAQLLSAVSFTPDDKFLVAGGGEEYDGDLWFWRIADGVCTRAMFTNGSVNAVKYSPDGSRFLIQDENWIFLESTSSILEV
jgi:WD40 repeat protein